MMARTKTFLAISLSDSILAQAQAVQGELAATGASAKWVTPANFHITLPFLGELDDRDLAAVCRAVPRAAAKVEPFRLSIAGLGAFPNVRRPRVVWAGIQEGRDEIQALYEVLAEALNAAGIATEDRAYTPHLTLGRIQSDEDGTLIAAAIPKYRGWTAGLMTVEEVKIMASDLRRDGPEYTTLGRAKLDN